MAGIDKTYISDWKTFDEIRNWALKQQFILKNKQVIRLKDYLYYPYLTEEEWIENERAFKEKHPDSTYEVILWNTPTYADIWLIRNCPFEVIQDRLKEQYGGGWSKTAFTDHNDPNMYEQIKNYCSIYDTFQRNGLGQKSKVRFHKVLGFPFRDKKCYWNVNVNPFSINGKIIKPNYSDSPWYNKNDDAWYFNAEAMPWTYNVAYYKGHLSKKKIVRLVKKWNFPKHTIVLFTQTYRRHIVNEFYVTVE